MKSHATLCGSDVHDCTTENPKINHFKNFIKNNEDDIFLAVDKSQDLIFLSKLDYFKKVNDFLGQYFEKIKNYDHENSEKDIENYRKIINNTFQTSLPKWIVRKLHPLASVSELYGTIKCHKVGEPIRGIRTGLNSIVTHSEEFLGHFATLRIRMQTFN
jgi:hypothetical protein